MLDLNDFWTYFGIAWATNIALNLIGTVKMYNTSFKRADRPLDFGWVIGGSRFLGDTITVFGLAVSLILTVFVLAVWANTSLATIPLLVYAGGALGSFIKRRMKKSEGDHLLVIDHGDYMIVTGTVLYLTARASLDLVVWALVVTYILHPIVAFSAYKLRLRAEPF